MGLIPAVTLDLGWGQGVARPRCQVGLLLQAWPALPKVLVEGIRVGGTGFQAVGFETRCEEGVRGTGVTSVPLRWPQMDDGIRVSGATLLCLHITCLGHVSPCVGTVGLRSPPL